MDPVLHKAHTVLTSAGKVPEFQQNLCKVLKALDDRSDQGMGP